MICLTLGQTFPHSLPQPANCFYVANAPQLPRRPLRYRLFLLFRDCTGVGQADLLSRPAVRASVTLSWFQGYSGCEGPEGSILGGGTFPVPTLLYSRLLMHPTGVVAYSGRIPSHRRIEHSCHKGKRMHARCPPPARRDV